MSEPVHIRQVAELKKSIANVRLMETVLRRELSVALLIDHQLTGAEYNVCDTIVTVNKEQQCIDVLVTYKDRTPATVTRSIPFGKLAGEEIKFLFDCSNINPDELKGDGDDSV